MAILDQPCGSTLHWFWSVYISFTVWPYTLLSSYSKIGCTNVLYNVIKWYSYCLECYNTDQSVQEFYRFFLQQCNSYVHETLSWLSNSSKIFFFLYCCMAALSSLLRIRTAKVPRFTLRGVKGNLPPVWPSFKIVQV